MMLLRDMVGNLLRRFPGLSAFAADDIAADVILFEVLVENETFFTAVYATPNNGGVGIRR
jgi:hypothetical protein